MSGSEQVCLRAIPIGDSSSLPHLYTFALSEYNMQVAQL